MFHDVTKNKSRGSFSSHSKFLSETIKSSLGTVLQHSKPQCQIFVSFCKFYLICVIYLLTQANCFKEWVTAKHPHRGEFVLKVLVKVNTTAMCSSNKHILISPINFCLTKVENICTCTSQNEEKQVKSNGQVIYLWGIINYSNFSKIHT